MSNHDNLQLPKHIAIICDGNRRWARFRNLPVFKGHEFAVNQTIEDLVNKGLELGIEYMTFWIFSTENWNRDKKEVEWLMNLFRKLFDQKIDQYSKKGVRVRHIGNKDGLAPDIQQKIDDGEERTKDNRKMTVVTALNYGGRDEIVRANRRMYEKIQNGEFSIDDLTEESFAQFLDTADMPDPDLIIRTSGEQRLSGFMSWQMQYSELYFPEVPFPEFTGDELEKAIEVFQNRDRRFGGNSKK